jgi:hypothetical protein
MFWDAAEVRLTYPMLQDVHSATHGRAGAAKSASDPASQQKSAPKKVLVHDFLKRKAEEQRKAARDFLKSQEAVPAEVKCADEPPAKVQCTNTVVTTTAVPQGIVRQKVYSSSLQLSEASVTPSESTVVQAVPGGVVRGKSYRRAG